MVLTYFLPMTLMTATYTAIGRELWGQQAIGEATEVQKESIKSKRRVNVFLIWTKSTLELVNVLAVGGEQAYWPCGKST